MKTRTGNIINLMLNAEYDVAIQGCNTQSLQRSGLARQMVETFKTDSTIYFEMESKVNTDRWFKFTENKLGCIDYADFYVNGERAVFVNDLTRGRRKEPVVTIVNCYSQAYPGRVFTGDVPLDYEALALCLRKINHIFEDKTVAVPEIGAGLARGDWNRISSIIEATLTDVDFTIIELP